MTNPKPERRSPAAAAPDQDVQSHVAGAAHRVTGAIKVAGTSAATVIRRVPGTVHATHVGASGTTNALRRLPDSTLRWLAASSVGLGAGFYLAGAPRLAIAAGVAPALFMGAAIVGRPIEPMVRPKVR
jgi:hypothetical protein